MKKIISLSLFSTFLLFMSCQDILECVINRHPELSSKTLAYAQINHLYSETIKAEIKNEPMDDNYDYYFSIDGNLPRGIDYYVDYRTIVFEGEPYLTGTYKFTIRLSVEQSYNYSEECENNFNDCDGLCSESTSQVYTIIVN